MNISLIELQQRCLEIIRRVEKTGKPVPLTRRGRVVAYILPPLSVGEAGARKPWEQLRALGGELLADPGESVLKGEEFEALR